MGKFGDLPLYKRIIFTPPTVTKFSVLPFPPLPVRYICGHNLAMKFPLDFHNYIGLNGLVNSLT